MSSPAPYGLCLPAASEIPLVVSIPHTGTVLPPEVEASLASEHMRSQPMTDWHLQHLYDFLPELGATTLYAVYSRFVVDLNRAPEPQALYPGRFETGLVPAQTFWGEAIFREPPGAAEVERRKGLYHSPYHAKLAELLAAKAETFGRVCLIDAHSVPSRASLLHGELEQDVYLGNRDGASCGAWLMDLLASAFGQRGLRVARNQPYKGGYITDHYGRQRDVDAVQIEMCQRVYMDEGNPASALEHPRFSVAKAMLRAVLELLAQELRGSG